MKVKAIMLGYYGNRRRKVGEVFEIPDTKYPKGHKREGEVVSFSKVWMVEVKEKSPTATAPVKTPTEPPQERDNRDVI